MSPRISLILVVLVLSALCGCGNRQSSFRQEKRQFAIVMESKLRQFDQRADDLATQLASDSLRSLQLDSLRMGHDDLNTWIAAIDSADATRWKKLKPALEAKYYDLERRYYEIAGAVAARAAQEAAADTLSTPATGDSLATTPSAR